ncbi:MAG: hypothetical protein ACPGSD_03930 [Flavobacteriales bacterium]
MDNQQHSSISYLALRQTLGVLGLALPSLLFIFNQFTIKSSISHYYYSPSSIIFTGFMITFGIFLIFYPGRIDASDRISDNWISSIGGIGAILTAIIPTAYNRTLCKEPLNYCIHLCNCNELDELTTPILHNSKIFGNLHLISAALFLVLMGYMSYARFTKGRTCHTMKKFYKTCAVMVWLSLAAVAINLIWNLLPIKNFTFYGECMALTFFGLAWLIKGKAFKGKICSCCICINK